MTGVPSGPVRVLQVVLSLNPGGTERLIIDLATRLRPEIDSAVCCLDEVGSWGQRLTNAGVTVRSLSRRPGFHPAIGRKIAEEAKRHRADVIHAHQYTPFVYSAFSRFWQRGVPLVFTEHGRLSDAPPSAKRRLANSWLGRMPEAIFAVSEDLKTFMTAEGFRGDRIDVIYNGIEVYPRVTIEDRLAARKTLAFNNETFVVGTIARFDPVKDLGVLLRAISLLPSTVEAILIGDGSEMGRLQLLAADLGIQARVRFLGHRDDARRWLSGCDAYVNSSSSEGVSLTILEAMSAALPVVATSVGGTPEVLTAECGSLIPARDPEALAQAIRGLSSDRAGAQAKGFAARARVQKLFTIEGMVSRYGDLYRTLAIRERPEPHQ